MYDYKKAFEGSDLTAQEQYDILEDARLGIERMKTELSNDCYYCPTCRMRYFKKACHSNTRKVKKTVCLNPLTGGYLDPYEYEEREVLEWCNVCPEGHELDGYVEW